MPGNDARRVFWRLRSHQVHPLKLKPQTPNPNPQTPTPKLPNPNPKPQTTPHTTNHNPKTPNPKHPTHNPPPPQLPPPLPQFLPPQLLRPKLFGHTRCAAAQPCSPRPSVRARCRRRFKYALSLRARGRDEGLSVRFWREKNKNKWTTQIAVSSFQSTPLRTTQTERNEGLAVALGHALELVLDRGGWGG